ncbi:branched-chain amino acid ABC transporter permease [Pengzhenrongella phosphoraccumulans]|uniref:branched-chain amino acid ABC transporter permease n=1 Tax=Pengzhenrongella phosphoraccumulans TaxID=3114394 RepID=UPI00388CEE0B
MDHSPLARRTLLATLVAFLALLALLVPAGPAHAADEACVAGPTVACINGTIRTAAGAPAVGIALEATGPDGVHAVTTGPEGRWSITVTAAGSYVVKLDPATLPAGETLRDPAQNPRTVAVELGSSGAALFPLGTPAAGGSAASPSGGSSATPGTGSTSAPAAGSGITGGRIAQQFTSGIVFGLLLALASVGLSLIYGTTGLSNFAHGEQVTFGGILAYIGCQIFGMPLLLSGILAVVIGAASGWLQDSLIWHKLRKRGLGTTQQMIVTIGFAMALQYTFQFFLGGSPLRIVTDNPTTVSLGDVVITQQSLISLAISAIALGGVAYFLVATRTGRATRAVSDNAALAAASGISVERIVRIVWTLGAGLAALGGVLLGLYFNATAWNMGATILLLMFAAVTLGGLGTAFGALVGSLVIGLVSEMSSLVIPSDLRYGGALLILILVLLFRPQGILGRAERVG